MDRRNHLDSLHFDDDALLDEKIRVIDTRYYEILVNELQFDGSFHLQTRTAQLVGQTRHICLFEQAWTDDAMHLDCALDNLSGAGIELAGGTERCRHESAACTTNAQSDPGQFGEILAGLC